MTCKSCPRADLPCLGETVPRICDLADPTHADHRSVYRNADALAPKPGPESLRPVAETTRLTKIVHACPWRSTSAECGCNFCGIDQSKKTVRECWACAETHGLS